MQMVVDSLKKVIFIKCVTKIYKCVTVRQLIKMELGLNALDLLS